MPCAVIDLNFATQSKQLIDTLLVYFPRDEQSIIHPADLTEVRVSVIRCVTLSGIISDDGAELWTSVLQCADTFSSRCTVRLVLMALHPCGQIWSNGTCCAFTVCDNVI